MQYVLVSSCLLGKPVRYDGRAVPNGDAVLTRWLDQGRVVAVCPEVATIGTGLGNARFTIRRKESSKDNGKDEKLAKKGRD